MGNVSPINVQIESDQADLTDFPYETRHGVAAAIAIFSAWTLATFALFFFTTRTSLETVLQEIEWLVAIIEVSEKEILSLMAFNYFASMFATYRVFYKRLANYLYEDEERSFHPSNLYNS